MNKASRSQFRLALALACAATLAGLLGGPARADDGGAAPGSATALRARFADLKQELLNNQFGRPLFMVSTESPEGVSGEIHSLVRHQFASAGPSLVTPAQWCDVLILHLNVKYCRPSPGAGASVLDVRIGRRYSQSIDEAYKVAFRHRVVASTPEYLKVSLDAAEGPLGTTNYRVVMEAAPADNGRTYIRLSYRYAYGPAGWLAMKAYLNTVGRDKVGFTTLGNDAAGKPQYIGGVRGVVERNTMRYYLAIEAFLGARSSPAEARVEKSLGDWFSATENYSRQLHEMERGDYMAMKRQEYTRQRSDAVIRTGASTGTD